MLKCSQYNLLSMGRSSGRAFHQRCSGGSASCPLLLSSSLGCRHPQYVLLRVLAAHSPWRCFHGCGTGRFCCHMVSCGTGELWNWDRLQICLSSAFRCHRTAQPQSRRRLVASRSLSWGGWGPDPISLPPSGRAAGAPDPSVYCCRGQ